MLKVAFAIGLCGSASTIVRRHASIMSITISSLADPFRLRANRIAADAAGQFRLVGFLHRFDSKDL